jgi:hypothetical protein
MVPGSRFAIAEAASTVPFAFVGDLLVPGKRPTKHRISPTSRGGGNLPRFTGALLVLLLCASIGSTQEPAPNSTPSIARDRTRFVDLLDRISSLPPEYKADLGFTVIDASARSLSAAQKRSLLDDIFHTAARSHYSTGITEASRHTLSAFLLGSSKLDTLDIQAGAIDRALPLTPQFAAQLFEEVHLDEHRANCEDAGVEDVSAFYTTGTKLLQDQRITTIHGESKGRYLLSLVSDIKSPAQIAPLAVLISESSVPNDEMSLIEGAFVSALSRITASDREMTAAEQNGALTKAVKQLAAKIAQSGIYPARLLSSYRGFLVRSLTSESCADRSLDRVEVAQSFNALLSDLPRTSPELASLSAVQLEAHSKGAAAPIDASGIGEQMMAKLYRIAAAQAARSTEEYRSSQPGTTTPESSDVQDLIQYALSLEPLGAQCPVCDFESKGALLDALVQLFPPGSELDKAVYAQVDFLSLNSVQKDDPVAWLHVFKKLINASRRMSNNTSESLTARAEKGKLMPLDTPSAASSQIRRILRESSDPVISTYMAAEDLLHLPYSPKESY